MLDESTRLVIYLIGGAPRSGKTTLAKMLLRERGVTFVPTDAIAMALGKAAPSLGISLATGYMERSVRSEPFVEAIADSLRFVVDDAAIEGEMLRPEHVALMAQQAHVRACFLVRPNLTIADLASEQGTWVAETDRDDLPALHSMLVAMSNDLEARCAAAGVPAVEGPSPAQLERALTSLLTDDAVT